MLTINIPDNNLHYVTKAKWILESQLYKQVLLKEKKFKTCNLKKENLRLEIYI